MDEFTKSAILSLDNDLGKLVSDAKISVDRAMNLQMLRLMRGRPQQITLNPCSTTEGWSPDGVKWYPSEPGTFTGNGGVSPETK